MYTNLDRVVFAVKMINKIFNCDQAIDSLHYHSIVKVQSRTHICSYKYCVYDLYSKYYDYLMIYLCILLLFFHSHQYPLILIVTTIAWVKYQEVTLNGPNNLSNVCMLGT